VTQARSALVALVVATAACGPEVVESSPVGQVLVIVDTDMPVPRMVSRLRVDLYAPDGRWFESRDVVRSKRTDWPVSFGVYLPDPARESTVLVRLRAYREGEVHDYRGERYVAPANPTPPLDEREPAPATDLPRLERDQTDATPATEPDALVTIDRLVVVRVKPNERLATRVQLHGACSGTMADIVKRESCVDTERTLAPAAEVTTTPDRTVGESVSGAFDVPRPCTAPPRAAGQSPSGMPLFDEEVCIDGGLFIFGSRDGYGSGPIDDVPRRTATLPPLRMDRYEVTVGRLREGIRRGFDVNGAGRVVVTNDGPLPATAIDPNDPQLCTFSTTDIGREAYPVTCVSWELARAFCMFDGGDLPTEAQWEYATARVGRTVEGRFAWTGDERVAPSCDQAVFGRGPLPFDNECNTDGKSFGVLPVGSRIGPRGDVSPSGVVDLTGSVSELMRDAFASFNANCWASQRHESPACLVDGALAYSVRGGSWFLPGGSIYAAFRQNVARGRGSSSVGFRCVRSGN
jgi:formylglycine-generating enzyme required for sulfatase activity